MQKALIVIGVVILVVGVAWPWLSQLPLGRLPGDIVIRKENSSFYFPITTMVLISVLVSIILSLFRH